MTLECNSLFLMPLLVSDVISLLCSSFQKNISLLCSFVCKWLLTSYSFLNSSLLKSISSDPCSSVILPPGNGEREARKASRRDSRQIQPHMELPKSEGQQPSLLPRPGGPQELLLLQGCPQGRIHRRQPVHAWELCGLRLPWSSPGGGHPDESQLLQHRKQALILIFLGSES